MKVKNNYLVKSVKSKIRKENLYLSSINWKNSSRLSNFKYPWQNKKDYKTELRALHDSDNLYLKFVVIDHNILTFHQTNNKKEVALGDRVEVFFTPDINLDTYYCLEIDPKGRVLDYSASYYRKFNLDWQWPKEELSIKTNLTKVGYTVEIIISLESMRRLNLINGNLIHTGIFRANCTRLTSNSNQESEIDWISWINPKTIKPDFHVYSAFGTLELSTN